MITLILSVALAGSPTGEDIYRKGVPERGIFACANCHGVIGLGISSYAPRLASQDDDYLLKQMNDFASGTRANDAGSTMRNISSTMTDEEIKLVVSYISKL